MHRFATVINLISTAIGLVSAWLLVPLILITCYEVMCRYLFDAPTVWAYELGLMLTGSYFLLGSAFTLKVDGHIREDIFASRFPRRLRNFVELSGYLIFFLPVTALLTYQLFLYAFSAYSSGERTGLSAWSPPVWPFRAIFFLSFLILTLQGVSSVVRIVTGQKSID